MSEGQSATDIAILWQASEDWLHEIIYAFNENGFDALDPKTGWGRSSETDTQTRAQITAMAETDPRALGLPFSRWGLTKLADHLRREGIVALGRETLRGFLRPEGMSWQATQTWKESNDSDFVPKMGRVLLPLFSGVIASPGVFVAGGLDNLCRFGGGYRGGKKQQVTDGLRFRICNWYVGIK